MSADPMPNNQTSRLGITGVAGALGLFPPVHKTSDPVAIEDAAVRALRAGRMGSWRTDLTTGETTGDAFASGLLGLVMGGSARPFLDCVHPDDRADVDQAMRKAVETETSCAVEFRESAMDPVSGEAGLRWLGSRGQVTEWGPTGVPHTMVGLVWDATASHAEEQRAILLAAEMDHRVKNTFAVLQSLINLGARRDGDKAAFVATLTDQLRALADAHSVTARLTRSEGDLGDDVSAESVLRDLLAAWLHEGGIDGIDITLDVDESLRVPERRAAPFAMLIHELVTNAAKYGPLGEAGGALSVTLHRAGDDLRLVWDERVGDAVAAIPSSNGDSATGFGSMLMAHCLGTLRARDTRTYTEDGLRFTLDMPAI